MSWDSSREEVGDRLGKKHLEEGAPIPIMNRSCILDPEVSFPSLFYSGGEFPLSSQPSM